MRRFLVALLALLPATATTQQFENISFDSTEVVPGIYMTVGANPDHWFGGGNLGFITGDDYVAVVDDGMAQPAATLVAHVGEVVGRPVDFIINTHYHGDHAGANAAFVETGTVVFAHDKVRERLLGDPNSAGGASGVPIVTFGDGVTFHLNGHVANVIHAPKAHTDGDSFIHVTTANVIFAGDLLFFGLFPYIDRDGGGTVEGYIAGQQAVIALADSDTKIIPGHGDLTDLDGIRKDNAMLVDALARVSALVDEGMSVDDIVAAEPLADYAADYDWEFINAETLTRTIYQDLTAGN